MKLSINNLTFLPWCTKWVASLRWSPQKIKLPALTWMNQYMVHSLSITAYEHQLNSLLLLFPWKWSFSLQRICAQDCMLKIILTWNWYMFMLVTITCILHHACHCFANAHQQMKIFASHYIISYVQPFSLNIVILVKYEDDPQKSVQSYPLSPCFFSSCQIFYSSLTLFPNNLWILLTH